MATPTTPANQSDDDEKKVIAVAQPDVELGGTGTLITQGIISMADYNAELAGLTGVRAYEQMRNDATVNASLDVIKLPILAASWDVVAGSTDDDVFEEHADFIEQELFSNINHTFSEFLREALNYLDYGRYAFEIVYESRDDGKIGWKKFAARMPKTIYYWQQDDGTPGIAQILPTGARISIPIEKLLLFINRKEGDNYEGRSVLRTSYRNWYSKDTFYKLQAIALERQAVGVPYVKIPAGATIDEIEKADEFVRNLRGNEESYLSFKDGWEFGFMNMESMGRIDPLPAITHHNREITKNVLAQFLELGASSGSSKGGAGGSSGGSHALSQDQSQMFILSIQYTANYIADIITKYAIKRLIDINFGPQEFYPQLKVSKIGDSNYASLAVALQQLNAGNTPLITPDPGLEDHLRMEMDLPQLPEEVRAENDFEKFMTNLDAQGKTIDDKQNQVENAMVPQEPNPIAPQGQGLSNQAHERKGLIRTLFGSKTAEQDAKDVEQEQKPVSDPKNDAINQRKSSHSLEVSQAKHEFDMAKMGARSQVMAAKVSGKPLQKEDYTKMQLDLLKAQSDMLDKVHNANMSAGKDISSITGSEVPNIKYAAELKEQLDHVIEELQNNLGETD